jgi:hypothetical protein
MQLKIISDGTALGTHIINAETGEDVRGVMSLRIEADAEDGTNLVRAHLTIRKMPFEIDLDVVERTPGELTT